MARDASTQFRTDLIRRKLKADNAKGEMLLYVKSDGSWRFVDDLDTAKGITIKKSAKRYKYANYALTPLASSIAFSVINERGKYALESGESVAGLFDIDTEVQVRGGYVIQDSSKTETITADLTENDGRTKLSLFHMAYSSGLVLDSDSGYSDENFTDLFNVYYDASTYDSATYTPAAYSVIEVDLLNKRYYDLTAINLTANSTNGSVYYRLSNSTVGGTGGTSTTWTGAGDTVNGNKNINVSDGTGYRYVQVAVIYDGVSWSDSDKISALTLTCGSYLEVIYRDNFLLDSPSFTEPSTPEFSRVECSGRDKFKAAIEQDVSLSDLSSGVNIDDLIKTVCDIVGIKYTSTSVADLSSFGARTFAEGTDEEKKAEEIFEWCMQIINQSGSTYQMYIEYNSTQDDNVLFVQPVPSDIRADYVLNFQHYMSLGGKKRNYDRLLKRLTVLSDKKNTMASEQLDSDSVTSSPHTLSWTDDAVYKRLTSSSTNSFTVTDVSNDSITISSDDDTISSTVKVFGNSWAGSIGDVSFSGVGLNDFSKRGKYVGGENRVYTFTIGATVTQFDWSATGSGGSGSGVAITGGWQTIEDGIQIRFNAISGHTAADSWSFPVTINPAKHYGEWLNFENNRLSRGNTAEIVNPLLKSSAECKSVAKGFIERFGSPVNEARSVKWPFLNLVFELNDMTMLWSRFTFTDSLYYITGVSHTWTQNTDSTSFDLEDSGLNFLDEGNIIYDRDYLASSVEPVEGIRSTGSSCRHIKIYI